MLKHRLTLKPSRGVTLIELILVLAISAFMIVLALGGLTNRGRVQFDDGVNQVLNSLRQVQNEAVNGQAPICRAGAPCLLPGQQVLGRGVSFTTTSNEYKTFLVNTWGPDNQGVEQLSPFIDVKKLPAGVKLVGIEQLKSRPEVRPETPKLTVGLIVFTRGTATSASDSQVRNVGYPHFFNQDVINPGISGRFLDVDASGYPAGARAVTYVNPREDTITLTFQSPDNTAIKASIVIDGKSGTMEIQR
jgi:type II secretory pathway pseudopilin PulG